MAGQKRKNFGFGPGFLGNALKDLQTEYAPENKQAPPMVKSTEKRQVKPEIRDKGPAYVTALPDGHMKGYHPGDMILDTYRVESQAIHGGMGAVWRVSHTGWNVDLAMKRPRPEAFQTSVQKEKFTEECRHWIDLGLHPNIVACYYVREVDEVPTIFSEWMENGSLENHIKNGTLYKGTKEEVQRRLLDIAIQFARGLLYAHENHLIHQDVKPDNLLLTEDWAAKVSDFGLARARTMLTFIEGEATVPDYSSDMTVVSPSGGKTPAYCSPEQAASQPLTRHTDIYSWGVSILEMYLGGKPWAHSGQLTGPLAGIACMDYFDMCVEHPIPEPLKVLLHQCMEQEPRRRPEDFGVVESELLKIYKTLTGSAYPRPAPKAAPDTPDSLNNMALSYMDLGLTEKAMDCWKKANDKDPSHVLTVYNSSLAMWRNALMDDLTAIYLMRGDLIDKDHKYLAARFEAERGNREGITEEAEENEKGAAALLTPLNEQTYGLDKVVLSEKPFLEISPDENLILAGDHGAVLYSLTEKKKKWNNLNLRMSEGAVNWEKGEICSTKEPADHRSGLHGIAVDHTLYLYNLQNGRKKKKIELESHPETCAYKDEQEIYLTSSHLSRNLYTMNLTDVRTGRILKERPLHAQMFTFNENLDILFRRDGACILLYSKPFELTEITFYNAENWEPVSKFYMSERVISARLDEDEDKIWCLTGNNIDLFELNTGKILLHCRVPRSTTDFTICGDNIVAATNDGYIKFIEPGNGRILRSISIAGSCCRGTLKNGKGKITLLRNSSPDNEQELFVINIPKFGYRAKWELSRIHTSSWRIELENRFGNLLNEARKAVSRRDLKKAEQLVRQATELDSSLQNDSRAKAMLHEINGQKHKKRLNGAALNRAVGVGGKQIFFSEDSKVLYIIDKNDTGSSVNIDTGEMLYGLQKTQCLSPAYYTKKRKREIASSILPEKRGQLRLAYDATEDGTYAAAIDVKTMGSPPKCILRMKSNGRGRSDWSTDLEPFYTTEETLHFMSDGRTLLVTRRMAGLSSKNLIVRFSFWNVPEHMLLKEFDITCGPEVNYFKFFVAPDEKAALIEYQIPGGSGKSLNSRPKYEYCMVDFRTGRKTKAFREKPADLKIHYDIIVSNRPRFTGVERQIFYIKDPWTVALTPLHPGEKEIEVVNDFRIPSDVAISPDGLYLAVSNGGDTARVCIFQLDWEMLYP